MAITLYNWNQNKRVILASKDRSEWHFNPNHSKLKIYPETEYKLVYTRTLQNMSPNISNNEPGDDEIIKKTLKINHPFTLRVKLFK